MCSQKKKWPEAFLKAVDEAKQLILANDAGINIQIIEEGSVKTRGFNRVCIFQNDKNIVISVPRDIKIKINIYNNM